MNPSFFYHSYLPNLQLRKDVVTKNTGADDSEYKEMMKRKQLEIRLDAANPNHVLDKGNRKPPPKSIAIIISKTNDASPDKVMSVKDSLAISGDDKILHYNSQNAFVALNYSPKIGVISTWLKSLSYPFCVSVRCSLITYICAS